MGKFLALGIVTLVILGGVFFLGMVSGYTMQPLPESTSTPAALAALVVSLA